MAFPKIHTRGYIRASRLHTLARQRKAMEDAGIEKIYIEGEVGIVELLRDIVDHEYTICVTTLGRLGRTRDQLREVMTSILDEGSTIRELSTGREISTKREATAAAMSLEAAAELAGDARAPTSRQARERGKMSGEARRAAMIQKRMPTSEAAKIWHNSKSRMSGEERRERMTGWTMSQIYRELGPRGFVRGGSRGNETD